MTHTRSVETAEQVGEVLLAIVIVHRRRRKGSPECCRDAGMRGRDIDADDSAVHADIRTRRGSTLRFHGRDITIDKHGGFRWNPPSANKLPQALHRPPRRLRRTPWRAPASLLPSFEKQRPLCRMSLMSLSKREASKRLMQRLEHKPTRSRRSFVASGSASRSPWRSAIYRVS